ncbi:MAG: ABC transporter ATP-binding protein [Ignavibacteriaceae bacterium]
MKLLISYLNNYWKLVVLALFLAAVNQVFSMLDPWIFRIVIDKYATKYDHYTTEQFIKGVLLLLAAAVGVAFVSRVAKNFQDYFVNVITQKLRTDVEKLLSASVNTLFTTLVGIIFVTIYAISISWIIAPIFFAAIPILGIVSSVLGKKIKKIQKVIVSETTALAGSTTESLRNIELVKSLGLGNQEINRLNSTTDKILLLELKKVRYIRTLSFIQGTTVNFIRTSILFIMLYLIFTQQITVGEFFSLFIYSFFLFGPLQSLGDIINIYREAEVSLNNFDDLISKPVESKPDNPVALGEVRTLTFNGVEFRHQSANRHAINGISFEVTEGETVAFVGPSGAGKTTLVKLLVGLYTSQQGNIFFNNIPGNQIDFDELREKIGFVTQDTQLFSGTIKENLLFVNPDATDQDCIEVLQKAAATSLLGRADNGLDTKIGEGGIKVSGGEKQRLSIARALLRKPNLLVFDEATSALDSLTEEEISKTIKDISLRKDLITIMIAHRLSTVMHADKIYVLEKGKIVESGKHEDLLEIKGLYYAMWRQQIGEREMALNGLLKNVSEN